ncbi:50S ribosome-binding protein YggL [Planctomycetota bacterium]
MKKRLRKKRRLGEFREFGFEVEFVTSEPVLDEFIDMIEENHLQFGGGGLESWEGYVQGEWRKSVTEEQREAVRQWLLNHPKIEAVKVGEFVDMWA